MSTETTIEQPVAKYEMPKPHKGQAVIYYPNGVVNQHQGTLGYVLSVSRANIELNVHGVLKETVCHKSDPVVRENQFARKCGVWDFCPRDIEIDERMQMLELRLAELESARPKTTK
jgi:hypothetical protein